jgi:hypothetical protein
VTQQAKHQEPEDVELTAYGLKGAGHGEGDSADGDEELEKHLFKHGDSGL